jgi:pimeloyl-ACP methyl ester carboxylesterase
MPRRFLAGIAFGLLLITPSAVRAQAATQVFDANGVKICYAVEGRGEPVVLIHGFSVNYQAQWALPGLTRALAKDYQVIAFDNRGHGRSGKPHDPKQYGTEMVEDVVRLLDHLKIKRAHVVGYSLGAFITLKLLTTHPDRLLTATLGGAGRGRQTDLAFLDELAESLDQGKGFGPLLRRLNPPGKEPPTEQDIKTVNQFLTPMNDVKALAAAIRGMRELQVTDEQLKANKVPTLALVGDLDPLKQGVDALRGQLANLEVVVIKGGDHYNTFARPEFLATLKEFLARHSQGGKAGSAAAGRGQP